MLPSETYLVKKFLAADSSGCLLCHNRDKAPPAFDHRSPRACPLGA